ncbi:MAG TPA: glycosyltransferase family 2 protein [Burkholderiaceae bacterium]|nr:glycosyltransferase family 2 protein [Burkholderiaceae bacterium]
MPLSVIIITHNEELNIADCLASLAGIASEIVVVDSGSTDRTVALARAAGAKIIQTASWPGFGPQKNIALDAATCDWVLSLDADERLTEALGEQIRTALRTAACNAYEMPRLSYFCGKPVRHGGWYPDHIVRLVRRGTARFSNNLVHESLIGQGPIGRLGTPLLHYSYRTMDDVRRKIDNYSQAGARQLHARGKRTSRTQAVLHGAWAFLRTYVFKLGVLDGVTGWRIACMNMRASYLKYVRLLALQENSLNGKTGA